MDRAAHIPISIDIQLEELSGQVRYIYLHLQRDFVWSLKVLVGLLPIALSK